MADTVKVVMYLDPDAADILAEMAPGPNRRGKFMSDLLRRAKLERQERSIGASHEELGRQIEEMVLAIVDKRARQGG